MSKEPRYRWIGMFVIGAALLALACIVFFGRFKFFEDTRTFITYFSGSVKGLMPGAPVRFRGAQVGTVKDVSIVYRVDTDSLKIPVLLSLDRSSVKDLSDASVDIASDGLVERMIQRGLRAQLGLDSIVTGQLYVQLDFMPNVPIRMDEDEVDMYPEIPTAPSPLEKIQNTLENLPLSEIVDRAVSIMTRLDAFLGSSKLHGGLEQLDQLITELRVLGHQIDIRSGLLSANMTMLTKTAANTLNSLNSTIKEAGPAVSESDQTLREIAATARSVRRLVDLLERQPQSIIIGKE